MSTTHHEPGPDATRVSDVTDDQGLVEHDLAEGGGPVSVSVHHDVRWPVLVALACAVLTVLGFSRALSSGDPLDWAVTAVPALVGVLMLALLRDARAPLLVADDEGVRVRRGATWTGLRWNDVASVEVRSRSGLRDGSLVLHLVEPEPTALDDDGEPVAAEVRAPREVSVPLGVGTRTEVEGLSGNLVEDLASLAADRVPVRVIAAPEPALEPEPEPEPVLQAEEPVEEPVEQPVRTEAAVEPDDVVTEQIQVVVLPSGRDDVLPEQLGPDDAADTALEPTVDVTDGMVERDEAPGEPTEGVAPAAPYVAGLEPTRPTRGAARAEVVREGARRLPDPPAIPAQRSSGVEVVTARIEDVVAETGPQPAADPVIGPVVAAARHRARLSIDTLSERTRIRPHVLECIEVDDFAPCGGDFYARGHLRTLARVFGLDADELVASYDAHYAQPEIEAKQVFEAELASGVGGGLRTTSTGPRWSLLAASVLLLVGIWGTARVFADDPQELVSPAPDVVDTAGLAGDDGEAPTLALAAINVTATGASPQVVVRDAEGKILWSGQLGEGQSTQVIGTAPFDVTASNGQAVQVEYLGKDRGTVGDSEAADNRRFG
ncbi:helix-turn-helix domain-containing protein [Nocardioides marmoraquaticus]